MTLLLPVSSCIRHIAARPMPFRSEKNTGGTPRRRWWVAAATAALLAAGASGAAAQLMSIPANFGVGATGAAGYSVPIVLPPGTAGVVPSLSLDYSSQSGNGIVGMGWSLSGLVSITRCPQTVAQNGVSLAVTYTASDRFCLSGQQLFAISGNYGADGTEYRTEIESFNRVISHGTAGNGPAWFEVHTKSGQTMQFGNTPDSQIFALCTPTVRSWAVNKVSDTKGNFYNVHYNNDTSCGGNGQAYPTEIEYTGNAVAGLTPYNSVSFSYTSRSDIMPVFQSGSQTKTTVLLTDIRTYAGQSLVADYKLAYEQGSATGRSRLTSVTLCAGDGSCLPATAFAWQEGGNGFAAPVSMNITTGFDSMGTGLGPGILALDINGDGKTDFIQQWNNNGCLWLISIFSLGDGTFGGNEFQPNPCQPFNSLGGGTGSLGGYGAGAGTAPGSSPDYGPGLIPLDLNGDGKGDLVQQTNNGGHILLTMYVSVGDGTFQQHQFDCVNCLFDSMGTGFGTGMMAVDLNGDGLSDLVQPWNNNGCLYFIVLINNGNYGFNVSTVNPAVCNGFNSMGPNAGPGLLPMDVNGDGKVDIVQQWNNNGIVSLVVYTSVGDGTFTNNTFTCPTCGFDSIGGGKGPGLIPIDLNGDGNIDLVQQWNNNGCLYFVTYLNQGNGTFFVQGINPGGCSGFDSTGAGNGPGLMPLDVNGDGKTDLVQLWNNNGTLYFVVYLSNGDGTFKAPISLSSGAPFSVTGTCFPTGVHAGVGYVPLGGSSPACAPLLPVDLNGDGLSDLLQPINNGGGLYFTSFLANPPFPDLLTNITTGIGATTAITYLPLTNANVYSKDSSATYPRIDLIAPLYVASRVDASNGIGGTYSTTYAYAGAKSDLSGRGFLGFRQTVTTDLQTNVVQTTNFLQTYPLAGMTASQTKTLGSLTLNQTSNTFNATSLGGTRQQVFLSQTVAQSNDLDGTGVPTITTVYQYDAYNNPTQIVVSTPDGFSKTTTNTYTNDTTNWFLGRLTLAQVSSTAPTPPAPPNAPAPPDMTIGVQHTGSFYTGQTGATYTITASNVGTGATSGTVMVTDTLPAGLTATAIAGSGWSCTMSNLTCTRSDALAGGAAYPVITLTVNVTATAPGTVNNSAIVSGGGDDNGQNNTATDPTIIINPAPPVIAKAFGAASIPLNGSTTLTITITNPAANTSSLTGVAFTDSLPSGIKVATPNALNNTCGGTATAGAGSGTVSLSGGTVAVSSNCTVSVSVSGVTAGGLTNTTGAVSSSNSGTGNTASANITVVAPPVISKAFSPTTIGVNGSATLTITITNPTGNAISLTGVGFSDTLPAKIAVGTPNALNNTCGGSATAGAGSSTVSLSGATLAVNSSCTVSVSVTGKTAGTGTNTTGAVVSTNGGTGNTASANITVVLGGGGPN